MPAAKPVHVSPYTEIQLEVMARELCRIRGQDPDGNTVDPKGSSGRIGGTLPMHPRWTYARQEVLHQLQVLQAINSVSCTILG